MKQYAGKIILLAVIGLLIGAFFIFDLKAYLSFEYIQSQQASFKEFYVDNRFLALGVYFVIYVVVTALSLPGAAILTLLGGALFGFWVALLVVSFASTIGATGAFLVSRFLLGTSLQEKYGDKLKTMNEGVEKDGAFYLFSLRLVPIFPFFVINLLMGLTTLPARTFFWVSQVGMLPGTAVFVNAGTQLGKLESASGILSPGLILSFVLLGVFPILAKKGLQYLKTRRGGETA